MTTNDQRIAIERKCIRYMLRALKHAGWRPTKVHTDEWETVTNEHETMDCIFSVDESVLLVRNAELTHRVMIVLGNGIDCVPDYTVKDNDIDGFDRLMDTVYDQFETYESRSA